MEELLKNETVRLKIRSLSAPVRKAFIESLLDLYEQETEEMIDVIEESRLELRGHFMSFEDEIKSLRAESRLLEEERRKGDLDGLGRKSGMSSRYSDSRLTYIDEHPTTARDNHRHRGKLGPNDRSKSSDVRTQKRAESQMSTRSLPTPVTTPVIKKTVEEEKDEVMNNLMSANRQNEAERRRQEEMLAQKRAQKRQQKQTTEEKALELLEKALAMDKRLAEKKQEQEKKLGERLEEKRRQAASRMDGPTPSPQTLSTQPNKAYDLTSSPQTSTKQPERENDRKSQFSGEKKREPKPEDASKKKNDYDFSIY